MSTLNTERIKEKKKEKRKRLLIISLIEIIISIWITNLITQFLGILMEGAYLSGKIELDYGYLNAVIQLIKGDINKAIFVLLEAIYLLFFITLTNPYSEKVEKVDTFFVTPDIEKPVPAGNGQHGNARFLREDEKEELYTKIEITGNPDDIELESCGIVVNYKKEGNKEIIYCMAGETHTLLRAATGLGKTRRVFLPTIALQMLCGISSVNTDIKGELFYYTSPFAKKRGHKVYPYDLRTPEKSIRYNNLQPVLDALKEGDEAKAIDRTWDIVSMLVGEQKGEAIWKNGECATIAAAILIVAIDAPEEYRNLTNTYYFIAKMCKTDEYGEMPINRYLAKLDDTHPANAVFDMARIAPFRTRSSFFTSALGTLKLFTNPKIAEMTSESDFRLEDIVMEKSVLYMIIPDEKDTNYPLVSLLLTQLYSAFIEKANQNGGIVPIPVDMNIDELGNFPKIPGLGNITSAGRSRGIRTNIIIQDDQQLEKTYKDDYKNIMSNCKNKIYLGGDNLETLKRISDGLNTYTTESCSASNSISGKSNGMDNNISHSTSSQLTGVKLLDVADLQLFKEPYALCQYTGTHAAVNHLPDLGEYRFNKMFGLGDKAHNRILIMEREAEREARYVQKINLWGIWKKYQAAEPPQENTVNVSFLD